MEAKTIWNAPKKRENAAFGLLLACATGISGCGASEGSDTEGAGGGTGNAENRAWVVDLDKHKDPKKAAWWFTRGWVVDSTNFFLQLDGNNIHVNDMACFTIGIGGDFGAHDAVHWELVRTRIDANGFYKGRAFHDSDLHSKVFWGCTAYENFITDAGGVAWISDPDLDFANGPVNDLNPGWPACTSAWVSTSTGLWWGDAMSWIGGLGGSIQNAYTDYAYARLSHDPFAPNQFRLASGGCNGTWRDVHGFGRSFFVGVPSSGKLVSLMGINSSNNMIRGFANSAGTFQFVVESEGGFSSRFMTHVDQGFCGLTQFSGQYRGNGEHVRVAAVDTSTGTFWKIILQKLSGDGVKGSGTCIAYDQRG